jgi:Flp pilus assembly pilin Flp
MHALRKSTSRFVRETEGQDVVEYALLTAFVSIFAIVVIQAIGPLVLSIYSGIRGALSGGGAIQLP